MKKFSGTSIRNKIIYGTVITIVTVSFIGVVLSMNDIKEVAHEGLVQHVRAVLPWEKQFWSKHQLTGKKISLI